MFDGSRGRGEASSRPCPPRPSSSLHHLSASSPNEGRVFFCPRQILTVCPALLGVSRRSASPSEQGLEEVAQQLEEKPVDQNCQNCGGSSHEESMILCDGCDHGCVAARLPPTRPRDARPAAQSCQLVVRPAERAPSAPTDGAGVRASGEEDFGAFAICGD